ncbi:MAG TPA: YbjN domain-containing protein [Mycobacteriales bacterium]
MGTKKVWLRSHVERGLMEIWQTPTLVRDHDGDYPYRGQTSMAWVAIDTATKPWMINVVAQAARGVPRTVKVLREINELNGRARAVKVFWQQGFVTVQHSLLADAVTVRSLRHAVDGVTGVADDIGPMFAALHDAETMFPAEVSSP